jgi:small neutral amino acid transporter SnatA (MarC family)
LIILVVSLFVGSMILRFFGISVPALRIAGGARGRIIRLVDADGAG